MKQLYSFQIQDPNAMSITFACVAQSGDEARSKVREAGYKDFLLMEVRDLKGLERTSQARANFDHNPLLGPEWRPFVEALVDSYQNLKPGEFWTLNWRRPRPADGSEPDEPYIQALAESDGGLLLEIGPADYVNARVKDQAELLHFMGWETPPGDPRLPNYLRWCEPGWNMWFVASFALQSLVLFMEVTPRDLFTVTGWDAEKFDPNCRLERIAAKLGDIEVGVAYRLRGQGQEKKLPVARRRATVAKAKGTGVRLNDPSSYDGIAFIWPRPPLDRTFSTERVAHFANPDGDEMDPVRSWGDQWAWTWAAVHAFQVIADPATSRKFPVTTLFDGVDELEHGDRWLNDLASFSALLALTTYRFGWSRPAWGLARYLANPKAKNDMTLQFIQRHWSRDELRMFSAFTEKHDGVPISGANLRHGQRPPEEAAEFLKSWGTYHDEGFTKTSQDQLSDEGGHDLFHLLTHLPVSWSGEWTRLAGSALPLREVRPNHYLLTIPEASGWYGYLQSFSSSRNILLLETALVDVYIDSIGFMGTYRYSEQTNLWHTCSRVVHLLGNPSE
jgi:hypothetical protein